jgi:hypothetical protein
MLGQPLDQTFSYDRHTVFVLWHGRVPTVVLPGQLHTGDSVTVRIRAPRSFSLAQVEQVPANHVGDHPPRADPQPCREGPLRRPLSRLGPGEEVAHELKRLLGCSAWAVCELSSSTTNSEPGIALVGSLDDAGVTSS